MTKTSNKKSEVNVNKNSINISEDLKILDYLKKHSDQSVSEIRKGLKIIINKDFKLLNKRIKQLANLPKEDEKKLRNENPNFFAQYQKFAKNSNIYLLNKTTKTFENAEKDEPRYSMTKKINIDDDLKILDSIRNNLAINDLLFSNKDKRALNIRFKILKTLSAEEKQKLREAHEENPDFYAHYQKSNGKYIIKEISRNFEETAIVKKQRKKDLLKKEGEIIQNMIEEEDLKERLRLFLQGLQKTEQSYIAFNSEIFIQILRHFIDNAHISKEEILDILRGEKSLDMKKLRKLIC
jgi:hypothetical protein